MIDRLTPIRLRLYPRIRCVMAEGNKRDTEAVGQTTLSRADNSAWDIFLYIQQ